MSTAANTPPTALTTGRETVLEVADLGVDIHVDRDWVGIVDGVDLTVRAGETVGLVGESGSGKTVTSLAVMQLLPPNSRVRGSVRLGGRELISLSEGELNRIRGVEMGMIFQEPRRSLNPAFTVGDQVAESVRRHRGADRSKAWDRAVELFELVGIPDARRRASAYPHEFSGGMCQRVMLAMALACEPSLLIADEPTTALDVTVQRQVLSLIGEVQQRLGIGVLLITHDLGVVAEVCDRAAVMYAGRIVEQAPVMELFDAPQHPYTAGLLHAMPDHVRHVERMGVIPGRVPPPHDFPAGCRFHPRCPFAQEPTCTEGEIPLRDVTPGHTARCARLGDLELEDAFYG
ncbi:ABC transporter ATP-binding protein [Pseudonocardia kunmingensis]|uniref:ABC transporter ATP-binding protein n=1 Tax=Pseudonocardia kunmingensis TaxID=630975 RepID=UPI001FE9EB84|nr:ABC transporter ATP-binding protein [Pseudonocardia kunmingensis]